jgi:hypothetical protein
MDHKVKMRLWIICAIMVLLLTAIGLSPLTIPANVFEPILFGAPYTLWMGFIVTVLLVLLTFLGSRVHPGKDNLKDK